VEADLRPMNLGLATAKRRAQDRSAWRLLVATATSSTSSWRESNRLVTKLQTVAAAATAEVFDYLWFDS